MIDCKMQCKNDKEQGFALVISMVLLLVMTLMASILVMNAAGQSKVTGVSESDQQTFLSAETGVESAKRWISKEVGKGTFPKNGNSTIKTLCNFDLGGTVKVAKSSSQSIINEMGITSSQERKIYGNQSYYWVVTEYGQSTVSNVGAGGNVGTGTNYSTSGGQMTYFYKVYACGTGPGSSNTQLRTMIETIIGVAS